MLQMPKFPYYIVRPFFLIFFFNDTSTTEIYTLSLHDALPISKMQLDNQKEIAEMQNETQKEIAVIQSATSRQNTKDQVYAQNEMLAYQQKESTARVASIMENTRSEERFSRNAETDLVCRLLLEKKKTNLIKIAEC